MTPQEFNMKMQGYIPTGIKPVDANGKSRKLELKATIRESLKVSLYFYLLCDPISVIQFEGK